MFIIKRANEFWGIHLKEDLLSIGYVSEFCRISVKTLRYYDDVGLVLPAYVNPLTRYRYYAPEQAEIVFLIKILRELGFSIAQIKKAVSQKGLDGLVNLFREREQILKDDIGSLQEKLDEVVRLREQYERIRTGESARQLGVIVLKKLPDRHIVFLRKLTSYEGLSFKEAFDRLDDLIQERKLGVRKTMMAVVKGDYREFDHRRVDLKFCYELLTEVTSKENFIEILPGGLYASLLFAGRYEKLREEGYARLYHWIENNGYSPAGSSIEIYHITRPVSRIVGDFLTELQVPVRKGKHPIK
ncbi:MAG: MerR family transcriptional regulator [Candidatus Aminicenantes bacterium]|nr:MerR family transcriptional regulator [Candidatus Aminicenantes bacterium]